MGLQNACWFESLVVVRQYFPRGEYRPFSEHRSLGIGPSPRGCSRTMSKPYGIESAKERDGKEVWRAAGDHDLLIRLRDRGTARPRLHRAYWVRLQRVEFALRHDAGPLEHDRLRELHQECRRL